jgi:hypothetical protein
VSDEPQIWRCPEPGDVHLRTVEDPDGGVMFAFEVSPRAYEAFEREAYHRGIPIEQLMLDFIARFAELADDTDSGTDSPPC